MPAHAALHCKCLSTLPAGPHVCVSPILLHASSAPLQPQIIFVGVYLLTKSGSQKPKAAEYDKVDDAAQQVCAVYGSWLQFILALDCLLGRESLGWRIQLVGAL